ncbi:unnamed protein product, partial [Musa acuminata var. zebrina]
GGGGGGSTSYRKPSATVHRAGSASPSPAPAGTRCSWQPHGRARRAPARRARWAPAPAAPRASFRCSSWPFCFVRFSSSRSMASRSILRLHHQPSWFWPSASFLRALGHAWPENQEQTFLRSASRRRSFWLADVNGCLQKERATEKDGERER